ncbi:MAG: ABC transporter ATP-binding protein [Euryarchaeota archaeon]|nr:ABC transporter ATP-binding protein [Euryarchaeota archaeon]
MADDTVIGTVNLRKYFPVKVGMLKSLLSKEELFVHAVDDVSFEIRKGKILGMVGESGCGKTTVGRLLTRLETPTGGQLLFHGEDIAMKKGRQLKDFRRKVQMVFQDPYESLNPRFTVFNTVSEPLIVHGVGESYEERTDMVAKALEYAELKPATEFMPRYPHELSGGQRQRVAIARTLVLRPEFIVADEPVSMLDVSIRAGIMNLMLSLKNRYGIPFLFVTHDVSVSRYMSDEIAVMYLGNIVEYGPSEDIIKDPYHPYTNALLSAVPIPDPTIKRGRTQIKGDLPSPINLPSGCPFHPRCLFAKEICKEKKPAMREVKTGHFVQCHFGGDLDFGAEAAATLQEVQKRLEGSSLMSA